MSERLPQPEQDPLDTELLHGRSLRYWHEWLSRDSGSVPCSRYGRDGSETAWWAIAAEIGYVAACGEDDDAEEALTFLQTLAVNDHDDILQTVREYWLSLPEAIREHLEYDDNGLNLHQQAALSALCGRYGVEFDARHYTPQFDLPDGYVAGWVGNVRTTIYVGCSPTGEISS